MKSASPVATGGAATRKPGEPASAESRSWSSALAPADLSSIQAASLKYTYRDIPLVKNPFDFALYHLLLWRLKPGTIIEVGSFSGGSAVWLADMLSTFGIDGHVYSVDLNQVTGHDHPRVTFMQGDGRALGNTLDPGFMKSIKRPLLVIEDADHQYETTLQVLRFFDRWLETGEYLVVEDGIVSDLGENDMYHGGPNRAIMEFLQQNPGRYDIDKGYCDFFGNNFTWCTNGFLRRLAGPEKQAESVAVAPESG